MKINRIAWSDPILFPFLLDQLRVPKDMFQLIEARHFDVAMSGILATPGTAANVALTKPYMEVNLAVRFRGLIVLLKK